MCAWVTVLKSHHCRPSFFPTSPHSDDPATEPRGAHAGSLTWSAVMFGLSSRHPGSQTSPNVFNGSELHSHLPEIHKLCNYGWHQTGPEEGRLKKLPSVVAAPALAGPRPAGPARPGREHPQARRGSTYFDRFVF